MKLSDQDLEEMFTKCDLNRDGEIDFTEFAAVIMGSPGYNRTDVGGGANVLAKDKKRAAIRHAAAAQRAAERGHHLIKTLPDLREKLIESFNKLNSGSSAAASFRRLKTAAGAALDAITFQGFMKYINLNKIPADPELVRRLFKACVGNAIYPCIRDVTYAPLHTSISISVAACRLQQRWCFCAVQRAHSPPPPLPTPTKYIS